MLKALLALVLTIPYYHLLFIVSSKEAKGDEMWTQNQEERKPQFSLYKYFVEDKFTSF